MKIHTKVKTAATSYPVTLAEVANMVAYDLTNPMHAREETYINGLIAAATSMLEDYLGRAFVTQTLKQFMTPDLTAVSSLAGETYGYDLLPDPIIIRRPPCTAVTSFTAYDQANVAYVQAAGNYAKNLDTEPATITLSYGAVWEYYVAGYYVIEYTAGAATAAAVPTEIKNALLMTIAQWYKDREQSNYTIPATATALVDHLKIESWDL